LDIDYDNFIVKEPDSEKLAAIFTELDFTRLLKQLALNPDEQRGSSNEQGALEGQASGSVSKEPEAIEYELVDTEKKFERFYEQLSNQKIFAFDTETNSLDAMKADLVGLSFSWKSGSGFYLPVKAPLGGRSLSIKLIQEKIGPIMSDSGIKKVGQNIKYDLLVMKGAGIDVEGVYFDTMVASYVLSPERMGHGLDLMAKDYLDYETISITDLIGKGKNQLTFDMVDTDAACRYAAEDSDITWRLYEYLSGRVACSADLKRLFEEVEMPLVTVLCRMEAHGVTLDTSLLRRMSNEISDTLEVLTDKIYDLGGSVFNIDSPKQLSEVLFDKLGMKSVKQGKTLRSTDASVLEGLKQDHEIISYILDYRQLVKLKNTYVDKLGQLINPRTNRVHCSFNQTVTATGRLSSSNPNLQNIPIRTELGRKIRSAFIPADERDCIISADYSQIELRMLAHFSSDEALTEAFVEDQDIHSFVASEIYQVGLDEVSSEMRARCKAVNFGIIYGQGPFGLSRTIGISQKEAKEFINDYFKRYKSIKEFMDSIVDKAKRCGYAETILGRRRVITGLNSRNFNTRTSAERMAVNTTIQGSAADLIKIAMINIDKKIRAGTINASMTLQIHDELVFEAPKKEASSCVEKIKREMTGAMKLNVPLKVDVATGPTWLSDK
jgi:DNA polymerase-1